MGTGLGEGFHPELRDGARWLPRGTGRPWMVWLARRLPVPAGKLPPGVTVSTRALEGRGTASVRIYAPPPGGSPRPGVLWIHGGGYVIGSARQDDGPCAALVAALDVPVISVDYRLAPRHPFPTPLEDCFAAWELIRREGPALGVLPERMALAGRSAGAGLAAALALVVHDRQAGRPLLQALSYPMLDDRTVTRSIDGTWHRLWDAPSNRLGWTSYLGREPGTPDVSHYAAPARRVELSGLPPAWIGVGTCDLFHDEDVDYARRLERAGVRVELEIVPGAFHGFDAVLPQRPVSRAYTDSFTRSLARALDVPPRTWSGAAL